MHVNLNIAKKLNILGFNLPCTSFITQEDLPTFFYENTPQSNSDIRSDINGLNFLSNDEKIIMISAQKLTSPTFDLVIDWFEKKEILITFDFDQTTYPKWCYKITKYNSEDYSYTDITDINLFSLYRNKKECMKDAIIEALNKL